MSCNALQGAAAAHWGRHDMKVVQLLLENGADVNARGGYFGNALQAAAHEHSKKVVQLLLENGADVNAQGGIHSTALEAASNRGRDDIVGLLLENGAVRVKRQRLV